MMLTPNTKEVIDMFLAHYPKSKNVYSSAIDRVFSNLNKNSARKFTYQDLLNMQQKYPHNAKHILSFFRFIYAFDFVDNTEGFDNLGVKAQLKKEFERQYKRMSENKQKPIYKPSLSIEQINRIEAFLNTENADNPNIILLGFCWYMLFYTRCDVDELRIQIDRKDFDIESSTITSDAGNSYIVPTKYQSIFTDLGGKQNTGFSQLQSYISRLGNYVQIENLTPSMITSAQKQNMLPCSQCGELFLNSLDNWVSINNRIVCRQCGEKLKKNLKCSINNIDNENVDALNESETVELSPFVYTFDTLQKKILSEKDYIDRYLFQNQLGKWGESFVYDYERLILKDTPYYNDIDNSKSLNPMNGYDILSYDKETGKKKHIEVKTTCNRENDFYITDYELSVCKSLKMQGENYYIYRVSNILAVNKADIGLDIICDIINSEKYSMETYIETAA